MSDRVFGAVSLALALFYAWAASIIPESFAMDVIGPSSFPYGIAAIMAICGLYFLLRPDPEPLWPGAGRLFEIAAAALVFLAYALALPEVGFVIATAVASFYLTWRLGTPLLQAVVVGVATSVGLFVIFRTILGLSLATGPLGF